MRRLALALLLSWSLCSLLSVASAPSPWARSGALPEGRSLLDEVSESLESKRRRPFRLELSDLSQSPPRRYRSSEASSCSQPKIVLERAVSGARAAEEALELGPSHEALGLERALLHAALCEPDLIAIYERFGAPLDVGEVVMLAQESDGFSYQVGRDDSSHVIVALHLDELRAMQLVPAAREGEAHRYAMSFTRQAMRAASSSPETLTVALSVDGKLRWTMVQQLEASSGASE